MPLRRQRETHGNAQSAEGTKIVEIAPRRKIGNVSLRLDILEVDAGAKAGVEHVEDVSKPSRVGLARVPVEENRRSTGIINPVHHVAPAKKGGKGEVRGEAANDLALADLLGLGNEKSVEGGRKDRGREHKPRERGGVVCAGEGLGKGWARDANEAGFEEYKPDLANATLIGGVRPENRGVVCGGAEVDNTRGHIVEKGNEKGQGCGLVVREGAGPALAELARDKGLESGTAQLPEGRGTREEKLAAQPRGLAGVEAPGR
jgi:hypothetical protein